MDDVASFGTDLKRHANDCATFLYLRGIEETVREVHREQVKRLVKSLSRSIHFVFPFDNALYFCAL